MRTALIILAILALLLGGAAFAGWVLFNYGVEWSWDAPHGHPATVADTTTEYSLSQLQEAGKADLRAIPDHNPFEDKSYVPPQISYVRFEFLASRVDKPFPKIFVADQAFPYNMWSLESVLAVRSDAMRQVLSSTGDLSCSADSATSIGVDRVEVLVRPAHASLKRCLISKADGCKYLDRLQRLIAGRIIGEAALPLDEMRELHARMECPTSFRWWWKN